jgi:hypothetical protein
MKGANMAKVSFRILTMALTVGLLAAPASGFAQSGVATREANVWGWRDHQPTEAEVSRKEKTAGIAPAPSRKDSTAATVDELYQQLMHQPPR